MATRRPNVEERLTELNDVARTAEALRPYLVDRSPAVVAKAARMVRDERVPGLEPELGAVLERVMAGGVKSDPGCAAKLALLEALDLVDGDDPLPFRAAARYVQMEPAFGGQVDTALRLRIRGAMGLVRLRTEDALSVLADHLADAPSVQAAAARSLVAHGEAAGGPMLRLRLRCGVTDGDVLTDCLTGVLCLEIGATALPLVESYLGAAEAWQRRAAALALGEARPEGAFVLLRDFHRRQLGRDVEDAEAARVALGLLRCDGSREYLEALERDEAERDEDP